MTPSSRALVALLAGGTLVVTGRPVLAQDNSTPPTGAYHVVKRIAAGGDGGWDYLAVDTASHRLYISRATHVMVIDTDRDSVVGDIGDTPGVHGIAIADVIGRGFISNGRDSSVTVFDLKTLAPVARVRSTGRNPDAILYEPSTRRVFAFNGGSSSATAIDAVTNQIVGTVALGGRPEFAQADGTGRVFVNLEDKSELVAFDARGLTVQSRHPLAPCEEPNGMALDQRATRLYIGCANKRMAVVDARTGHVVTTVPAGDNIDATAFDPATRLAFASAGDGTLTVVATAARTPAPATVTTGPRGKTMALDPRTHRVYVPVAQYGPTPAPTAEQPRPRPAMVPGSFTVLVLER